MAIQLNKVGKMEIKVEVKVVNTKGSSDLHHLFIDAARGDMVGDLKDPEQVKRIEGLISDAFDSFAQKFFDLGRGYEVDNR